ncbi:MAG: hypothetical protein IJG18_13615 [Kiritimatiellae bacterium]|nr:hypothetical protein [Kiritimatiellia bacterium]
MIKFLKKAKRALVAWRVRVKTRRENRATRWHLNACLIFAASSALMWSLPAIGTGYEPDPEKYQKALRDVVEFSCKEFAQYGIAVDPSRLKYGDQEIVDSFLKGREYYRDGYRNEVPLEPKLVWLAELFGDRYAEYEGRWRRKVSEDKAHPGRVLSKEEISERLDALKSLGSSPVEMDSGMCRSSSGYAAIDADCIHCGRSVVYSELDEVCHGNPPAYYKKVAEELGRLGIKVEVDGRAACPKCCPYPCDFKLGEFARKVRFKDDVDWSKVNDRRIRALRGDQLLTVTQEFRGGFSSSGYDVFGIFKEAWVRIHGNGYMIYEQPGKGFLYGMYRRDAAVIFAEPREEVTVPGEGIFVKIVDFVCPSPVYVPASMVDVVVSAQASKLEDIPPTFFIVNGNRFPASEYTAQLLLAFAKGYSRFYAGAFQDHYAVAQAEPWLRKVLLGEPSAPAPHINGVPGSKGDGFRMRWELDQDWYFKSFLPGIQAELEKIDSNAKDLTVAFEPASKSEMPYEGPVAGFAGAVKWNIFGATPEKWEVDMEYGICAIWGNAPCRHYVVLVTSLGKDNNARCRIYETTGSDTYGFRRKVSELDSEDKTFSAIGEFWAKDQKGADVLVITPWLRRGTAQCVYTR